MSSTISLRPVQFPYANTDTFTVRPHVTNTTETKQTETVRLSIDSVEKDARKVTLPPNRTERVPLSWNVNVEENTILPVTVHTSTDTATQEATFKTYNNTQLVEFDEATRQAETNGRLTYTDKP